MNQTDQITRETGLVPDVWTIEILACKIVFRSLLEVDARIYSGIGYRCARSIQWLWAAAQAEYGGHSSEWFYSCAIMGEARVV